MWPGGAQRGPALAPGRAGGAGCHRPHKTASQGGFGAEGTPRDEEKGRLPAKLWRDAAATRRDELRGARAGEHTLLPAPARCRRLPGTGVELGRLPLGAVGLRVQGGRPTQRLPPLQVHGEVRQRARQLHQHAHRLHIPGCSRAGAAAAGGWGDRGAAWVVPRARACTGCAAGSARPGWFCPWAFNRSPACRT
jgi:hypothetical protein